ncbi:MAG TPA: DUF6484 domain-containing protein [Dongiaceae bacterium]|nr:DUF6484 domain-containing protein [Dongiaceae bacterium]
MSAFEYPPQALENPQQAPLRSPVYGVVVGQFMGLNSQREPLVVFPGQEGAVASVARTIVCLSAVALGIEVLLQFDQGDIDKPIILGVMQDPAAATQDIAGHQLEVDGQRLQIQAKEQLVLRCGAASITLTKAGKVLIKGTYVSSHSSGAHRIRGGSVQIN